MNNKYNYKYYMDLQATIAEKRYLFSEFVIALYEVDEDVEKFIAEERSLGMPVKRIEVEDTIAVTKDSFVITDDNTVVYWANLCGAPVIGLGAFSGTRYSVERLSEVDEEFFNMVYMRTKDIPCFITATERTYIREITVTDLVDLRQMYGEPGVREWVEPLYPEEEEINFTLSYIENMYGFYGYGLWLVFDKESDELIGRAGLSNREINGTSEVELGYIIRGNRQRQGYGTEVCRAIIDYAAVALGIGNLYACIEKANTASAELARKLGFVKYGENETYDIYSLETVKSSLPS